MPHPAEHAIREFAAHYPFELDRFQVEAIRAYLTEGSVLVAAPTGTGKTVIAEFGVRDAWTRGHRVIYTTPIKALSNQKYRDFREVYGDDAGLLTGDIIENRDGRIIVMTTEVLRNMLLQSPWELNDVACVVFDEVHYIADLERGTTWEEAIILCPDHIQMIALSATVSNAGEIAEWMSIVHRPTRLITHFQRAVPLSYYYFLDQQLLSAVDASGRLTPQLVGVGGEARLRTHRGGPRRGRPQPDASERPEPQPPDMVAALRDADLLPAICFLFSRRDCEAAAELCASMRLTLVRSREQARQIDELLDHFLDRLTPEDRKLQQVQRVVALARKGLGFHHAGLLPVLKQLVEELFGRALMGVVFATDTLALGVNMPARSVVVGQMSKFDGQSVRPLIPNEFQQMAGRAGRRGIDTAGYVVLPYSQWISFEGAMRIATGTLLPVESTFALRYNTVLNLWDPPQGDRVLYVLQQSLMQFQMGRRVRDLSTEIEQWDDRLIETERGCLIGYDDGETLLSEYDEMRHTRSSLKRRLDEIKQQQRSLDARLTDTPWQRPTREALRKLFRDLTPGVLLHLSSGEWTVYLGRPPDGAVRVLRRGRVARLQSYTDIDYLPSAELRVELPEEVRAAVLQDGHALDAPAAAQVERAVQPLELPDLARWAERHRERIRASTASAAERLHQEGAQARQHLTVLSERLEAHPCERCPVRKQHRANLRRAAQVREDKAQAERELESRIQQEQDRAQHVLRGIVRVLHNFGYLQQGYATDKTDMLANVFDTNGLVICEMLSRRLLAGLRAPDIAEVFSWFAYDRDRQFRNQHVLPNHLVQLRRELAELEGQVIRTERRSGVEITRGHNPYFFGMMRSWCNGRSLGSVLEKVELSEGDVVLTFNKAVDLMRQVYQMLLTVSPDDPFLHEIREAMRLARRGIIQQSYAVAMGVEAPPLDASEEMAAALSEPDSLLSPPDTDE